MVKKLIFLILFLSFISFNYAANCGGNVTCQCGDTIVEDYEMSNDLVCSSGTGLNFASNVELDCNRHSIIGSGSGIGLYFYSYDNNNVVDNCVISNFDKGVHFNYYKYNTNTYFYPQLNVINNSEFINNNYGIYSSMGKKIKLFSNIFKNNSINSIYLDGNSEEFTISNNKIYDVPIDYRSTGSHSFCQDGIANEYFNDIIGPSCNCIIPLNNMVVNSDAKLCPGTYELPQGLQFDDNGNLDCQGSKIKGEGVGQGLYFYSHDYNNLVNNCQINNYKYGAYFRYYEYSKGNYHYPQNNIIQNSEFTNNEYGIYSLMGINTQLLFNTFKNNSLGSIYLDGNSKSNIIAGNNIYDIPIDYRSTGSHSFCQDGIANEYFNDIIGPSCDCIIPLDGLFINNDVNLCDGEYYLPNGFNIFHNIDLNCNGATLIGNGNGIGINFDLGDDDNIIRNCNFKKFNKAISFSYNGYICPNFYSEAPTNNVILNNTFSNNSIGIYSYGSYDNKILNNNFYYNEDFAIYLTSNSEDFIITNNNFFNKSIDYRSTGGHIFCESGVGNHYFNNVIGPSCDCIIPLDNMIVNSDIKFCKGEYYLPNGLDFTNGNNLDCQGAEIKGTGFGIGIDLNNRDSNNIIKNCKISNYDKAIQLSLIGSWESSSIPRNNILDSNEFRNNNYGIYSNLAFDNRILNNKFQDNNFFAIYLTSNSENFIIANNIFFNKSIDYRSTGNHIFCENGIGNQYLNNIVGPSCDCVIPLDNMKINSDVKFCNGIYNLPNGLSFGSESSLDCQDSYLIGNGNGIGLNFDSRASNNIINNCKISNYSKGIQLHLSGSWSSSSIPLKNIFNNNEVFNNDYGVYTGWSWQNKFLNNKIYSNYRYNIYSRNNYQINATNNWWGVFTDEEIESTIYNVPYVDYKPYSTKEYLIDLSFNKDKIYALKTPNSTKLIFTVENNGEIFARDFELKLVLSKEGKFVSEENIILDGIYSNSEKSYTLDVPENFDSFHLFIDNNNLIKESNEDNNHVFKELDFNEKFYLDIDVSYRIENQIKDYIKNNLGEDLIINQRELEGNFIILGENCINYTPVFEKPYEAVIDSTFRVRRNTICIQAEDDAGYIAGVKYLISNLDDFMFVNNKYSIGRTNVDAIGISDILENTSIFKYRSKVEEILNDKAYYFNETFIPIPSPEGDINYRLWKLESQKSHLLKSYIDQDQYPIVMSGGIYSNVEAFEHFGKDLANEGFEVYLLEITGGEDAENDSNYDYTYEHLVENVFPSYFNYIQLDSSSPKIKYVGHSNGCRVALDSLNKYNLESNVDLFVGLGCPILLNEMTGTSENIREIDEDTGLFKGDIAIQELKNENETHIFREEYAKKLEWGGRFAESDYKISLNLQDFYNELTINESSIFHLNNVASNHLFFAGNKTYEKYKKDLFTHYRDDGVVPVTDLEYLNNILSNSSLIIKEELDHTSLIADISVFNKIKEELK